MVTAGLLFLIFIRAGRVHAPMSKSYDITESLRLMEQAEWNDCGVTSEIAMSRGCLMEPLIYGWVPPQCLFEELTMKYPVFEDRTWYTGENRWFRSRIRGRASTSVFTQRVSSYERHEAPHGQAN